MVASGCCHESVLNSFYTYIHKCILPFFVVDAPSRRWRYPRRVVEAFHIESSCECCTAFECNVGNAANYISVTVVVQCGGSGAQLPALGNTSVTTNSCLQRGSVRHVVDSHYHRALARPFREPYGAVRTFVPTEYSS